ncbi:cell wall hydrolase, possible N-acetylmuramoyl-L-alanine amidase domain protein [Bacillus anthracis]|nr:NLP/P60 protein [Bacillus anthracis str. CDC 684]AFH86600.1 Hypothetical Protein H9401_5216 [Bacillus anthracis str. H9401]AHK41367.1 hypothetical protein BAPAT_5245 [Bacillus anthracis str. SVA11]EJT18507.1 hypothetical protein B353_23372 [Bacillus anthracis str. UR-1]KFL76631.1 cell wall hydrolase, possible N-acetylmuramoyl-L-alanine amidase domain protein [Bacillus anthracis]
MKKYLAGLAAVSVAGGAAPTLDSVQAAPEQNTQKNCYNCPSFCIKQLILYGKR